MKLLLKIPLWLLAFVPLVVIQEVFYPAINGKSLLIRSAVALVAVLFAVFLLFSSSFRKETGDKINKYRKNPLVIAAFSFVIITIMSTFFAYNRYIAFYGDGVRAEGLVGFLSFFAFFVFSLLVFEKNDWLWFFRLNLLTGIISFIRQLIQFHGGMSRPYGYTGQPTFLAGYFLFVVLAGFITYMTAPKNRAGLFWKLLAAATIMISVAGIFLTGTRGAIIGLAAGFFASLVYMAVMGGKIKLLGKLDLQKAGLLVAGFLTVMVLFFAFTRTDPFWKSVPALRRFSTIGTSKGDLLKGDLTIETRLIAWDVSLKAANPLTNPIGRVLLGWGPENFFWAYNEYYDPAYYQFEHAWFDRAHNKLMDVLVMNGVAGLVCYLALWGTFVWLVFRKKGFSLPLMAVLFFGASYFVRDLTLFDEISTYIPFFASLAFLVFLSEGEDASLKTDTAGVEYNPEMEAPRAAQAGARGGYVLLGFFGPVAGFYLWSLIFWTIVPFAQMVSYVGAVTHIEADTLNKVYYAFTPFSYAQPSMREDFLKQALDMYENNRDFKFVYDFALGEMEELALRKPANPAVLKMIGEGYEFRRQLSGDISDLKKAEVYFRRALALAPRRQDIIYDLAMNQLEQGKSPEAVSLLTKAVNEAGQVPETHFYLAVALAYSGINLNDAKEALDNAEFAASRAKMPGMASLYRRLMGEFGILRDKKDFMIAAKGLEILKPGALGMMSNLTGFGNLPIFEDPLSRLRNN